MPKIIENIRETILMKGKEMLLEANYSDFNIRNLAKNCGLGLGTLYNYFENKEVLVYNIFKSDWEITLQLVSDLKDSKQPLREKLRIVYSSLETFIGQYLRIFKEMSDGGQKGSPHDHYLELHNRLKDLILAEQGMKKIQANVDIDKLSYFIMSNMLNNIEFHHLTFDEMIDFIKI